MATPLDVLQKQNAALKQHIAAQENKLSAAAEAILTGRSIIAEQRERLAQMQDLQFAILHSFGPEIHIEIDDFRNFMQNAQFTGMLDLDDTGKFTAKLMFYIDGAPQQEQEPQTQPT